jgi:hypothetical protein
MNLNRVLFISVIIVSSCSGNQLTELSLNCACIATEHYVASTNDVEDKTKKYTFTNSRLFGLGVARQNFAESFAIQIASAIGEDEEVDFIQIDITNEESGVAKKSQTFDYDLKSLNKELPSYLEVESVISTFVGNIYDKNYDDCLKSFEFEDKDKFISIAENILKDLNSNFREARIVSYEKDGNRFSTFGIIKTYNEKLDLFTMDLAQTDHGIKIISFNF